MILLLTTLTLLAEPAPTPVAADDVTRILLPMSAPGWWTDDQATLSGPVSRDDLVDALKLQDQGVRACYAALQASTTAANGAVGARFTVEGDGHLSGLTLSSEQIPVPWFQDCLRDTLADLELAPRGAPTTVAWTFTFSLERAGYPSALGGLIGDRGTQLGSGGLGARGSGLSDAQTSDPVILGALDKSLIDAVIKRNMNKIRYCYQRELTKNPGLAGKITEKFVIAKDGSVSAAQTKTTTMNNPAVEACIDAVFMKLLFPEPKGGGIVIVSYPFIFEPG